MYETTKADNTAVMSLLGVEAVFQNASDGSVYVLSGNSAGGTSVTIDEAPGTGDITVLENSTLVEGQSTNVSAITVRLNQGDNTVESPGVTVPMTICGGSGSDVIGGGNAGNVIYGGSAGGNLIEAGRGTTRSMAAGAQAVPATTLGGTASIPSMPATAAIRKIPRP